MDKTDRALDILQRMEKQIKILQQKVDEINKAIQKRTGEKSEAEETGNDSE